VRGVTAPEGVSAPSCAPEFMGTTVGDRGGEGDRIIQSVPRFLVRQSSQEQECQGVLAQVAQHDFYHLAEYHRLAEERGEGTAHLFAYHDGAYTIPLPLLLRPVQVSGGETWSDAPSVYGDAGPVASLAAGSFPPIGRPFEPLALVGKRS